MTDTGRRHSSAQLELAMQHSTGNLWDQIWSKTNLLNAIQRIEKNNGAPGLDGMKATELRGWFQTHWPETKARLDAGHYKPRPTRSVDIPKPQGGTRTLGIPTVIDRLIQQAILQILSPIFDPTFSEMSFGFRPKRSAHQATRKAKSYINEGYATVIEVDLDKFFDRVHHDILMKRVAKQIKDKRVLKLIGRFLRAGIMESGVKRPSEQGTPQGSPLSPLLANIMLDDLDKELEQRQHRFVRYADDIRIFVKSPRAADRVMQSVSDYITKRLKLKVNKDKSKVVPATQAEMLGFKFVTRRDGTIAIAVADHALHRLKQRLRELTKRSNGISMQNRIDRLNQYIRSWMAYFALADTQWIFTPIDAWLRRRIRQVFWKQWPKARTKVRMLEELGIPHKNAYKAGCSSKGSWRNSRTSILHKALSNGYLHNEVGLVGFEQVWSDMRSTY